MNKVSEYERERERDGTIDICKEHSKSENVVSALFFAVFYSHLHKIFQRNLFIWLDFGSIVTPYVEILPCIQSLQTIRIY